jgi:hypothetical protein
MTSPLPPEHPKRASSDLGLASLIIAAFPFVFRIVRARSGQAVSSEVAFYSVVISTVLAVIAIGVGIAALIRSSQWRRCAIAGIAIGLFQLAVYAVSILRR